MGLAATAQAAIARTTAQERPPAWLMKEARQDAKQVGHQFWYDSPFADDWGHIMNGGADTTCHPVNRWTVDCDSDVMFWDWNDPQCDMDSGDYIAEPGPYQDMHPECGWSGVEYDWTLRFRWRRAPVGYPLLMGFPGHLRAEFPPSPTNRAAFSRGVTKAAIGCSAPGDCL
jgi:hypothetical protein